MTDAAENPAAPPKPGPKTSNRRRAVRIVLVFLSVVVAWTWIKAAVYGAYTRSFLDQMNQLGRTLNPGQVGTVRVPRLLADEIVLLTPYSSWGPVGATESDEKCTLVWLSHRRVVATSPFLTSSLDFLMEGDPRPPMWKIDQRGEIRLQLVRKFGSKDGSNAILRFADADNPSRVIETPHEVDKP